MNRSETSGVNVEPARILSRLVLKRPRSSYVKASPALSPLSALLALLSANKPLTLAGKA